MIHLLTNTYAVIDPWFGRPRCPIEFDMGCGKGLFSLGLAVRFPDRLILASDVMAGRLGKLDRQVGRRGLRNVELLRANSLELVGYQMPDACVQRVHVLCPDPWPKARHRSHRLVTSDFLARLSRLLEPGGIVHLATDHAPYLDTLRGTAAQLPFLTPAPEAIADLTGLKTDFEIVWEGQGREVGHLAYRRTGAPGIRD